MANQNSVQYAKLLVGSGKASSNELGGRLRSAYFTCTVPTGSGDTMTVTKLPKYAKVLGGFIAFTVAQGATATTAVGISGTTGKYRAAAITNATTQFNIATTPTENFGSDTAAEEVIILTNAAAAWTAATCYGRIDYMVD